MRDNMKRIIIAILTLVFFTASVYSAPSFSVNAPGHVSVGSKFAVTFRLKDAEGSGLKIPQINGCTLLYGPSTSTSQSYQVYNGQMTSSSTIDYTYFYRADQEGTFTIGEATINVDGKTLSTKATSLTIGPAPAGQQNHAQGQSSRQQPVTIDDISTQSSDRPVNSNDVFVRIILSKPTAYEQEAIECTIKLYTKYSISSFFATKQPSFDGFLIEEMDVQPSLNQVETLNGQKYMTALLKKCIIFPQKDGKLTINSGNYDITVVQYDNVNMGFFTVQNPQERQIKVNSNTASINIQPLPSPQPEGFTGAVGRFTVDSRLVGNSFRTNDPATLIYTISGTGNIKYIKEPVIDFPSEFEQYTPKSDISSRIAGNNVTGTMTIEYTFVPQSVGEFKIGSDKFVYFDIDKKEYVTINTPTYDIKVAKGVSSNNVERQDVSAKNTDILHIKTGDKKLSMNHDLIIASGWYWMLYLLLIISIISVAVIYRRNIRKASDISGMKLAKASKVARKRLKLARQFMEQKNADKFYEELLRAVWGYLSDKLMIPASQLSRDNISLELTEYGASAEDCRSIIEVLDECEMARYSPASSQEQIELLYAKATESIDNLEKIKRRK